MRTLSSIAEHQMVAAFLLAERTSPDFGPGVEHFRSRLGIPEPVIAQPDLSSVVENGQRARVLGYRGYGRDEALFAGFPAGVAWGMAEMELRDLQNVRYLKDPEWTALTGGSRRAADAAQRLTRSGRPGADEKLDRLILELARGRKFPPLILVGPDAGCPTEGLTLLEGHARLTAYLLRPELVSWPLEVIVGYSPDIVRWAWF